MRLVREKGRRGGRSANLETSGIELVSTAISKDLKICESYWGGKLLETASGQIAPGWKELSFLILIYRH